MTPHELREVAAGYFFLPSPCLAPVVGCQIILPSTEHNPVIVDLYGDALMNLPAPGDAHWRVQHDAIADAFRDHCVHDLGIAVRREVDDLFQQAVPLGNTVPRDELKDLVPDAELSLPAFNVVTGSYDPRSLKSTLLEFKTMRYGVKYTSVPRATAVDRFERSLLGDIQRGLAARDAACHNTEPGQKDPLRDILDMSEYTGMVFGTVGEVSKGVHRTPRIRPPAMSAAVETPSSCDPSSERLDALVSGVQALDVQSAPEDAPRADGDTDATEATVESGAYSRTGAHAQPAPSRRARGHQHDHARQGGRPQRSPRYSNANSAGGPGAGTGWAPPGHSYPPSAVNLYAMYGAPLYPTSLAASPPAAPQYFPHLPPPHMPTAGEGSSTHLPHGFPTFPSGSFGPGGYMFGSSPPTAAMSDAGWSAQFHQPQHPPHHMQYAPPPPPRRISSCSGSGDFSGVWQPESSSSSASGKPPCAFFMKTGTCAYGDKCKFDHPAGRQPPQLNSLGYPIRPNEVDCVYFMKKGVCGFGITCKFNHPEFPTSAPAAAPHVVLPQHPAGIPAASPTDSGGSWSGGGTQPPPPPPTDSSSSPHGTPPVAAPLPGSPTAALHEILGISPPANSELSRNTHDKSRDAAPSGHVTYEDSPTESLEEEPEKAQDQAAATRAPMPPAVPVEAAYSAPPAAPQEAVMAA
eukprot:jgi/Tetstr1/464648/TSEL_009402.t1